jgi:hypothetical protein
MLSQMRFETESGEWFDLEIHLEKEETYVA